LTIIRARRRHLQLADDPKVPWRITPRRHWVTGSSGLDSRASFPENEYEQRYGGPSWLEPGLDRQS